ncbi:MAG: cysteine desulfurase [Candidatus Tectomicrobia bacterium]|nr:cysteine desulfurase [Candidatus Tectomicrobia bacterium]
MRLIYLDHNATTPVRPEVLEAMLPYLREHYGNASSLHTFGRTARKAVEEARGRLAHLIHAEPDDLVFTGCGSEADSMALKGVAFANRRHGSHLVTTNVEHQAVLDTCRYLAERFGFEVTYLPVDAAGLLRLDDLRQALRPDTILVSIMHANNEVGVIQPLDACADVVRDFSQQIGRRVYLHSDCVQSLGKLPIDVRRLDVDLLTFSGHKLYAPKGVGALYVREATVMDALINGGHQELNRRGGTENVAGIVALGAACALAEAEMGAEARRLAALRDRLEAGILGAIPEARVNGDAAPRLPNTLNLSIAGVDGESLLINLDLEGIAVSTGSACSSGSVEPSHVLRAMGVDKEYIRGSVRLSLGHGTSAADVDATLEVMTRVVERMRQLSPQWEDARALR